MQKSLQFNAAQTCVFHFRIFIIEKFNKLKEFLDQNMIEFKVNMLNIKFILFYVHYARGS